LLWRLENKESPIGTSYPLLKASTGAFFRTFPTAGLLSAYTSYCWLAGRPGFAAAASYHGPTSLLCFPLHPQSLIQIKEPTKLRSLAKKFEILNDFY
jgi:hypothetical protein